MKGEEGGLGKERPEGSLTTAVSDGERCNNSKPIIGVNTYIPVYYWRFQGISAYGGTAFAAAG
jgi:hypothetical protein